METGESWKLEDQRQIGDSVCNKMKGEDHLELTSNSLTQHTRVHTHAHEHSLTHTLYILTNIYHSYTHHTHKYLFLNVKTLH